MRPSVLADPAKRLRWSIAAAALAVLGPGSLVPNSAAYAQAPPATIEIQALVRDFKGRTEPGGHPDFERNKALSAGGLHELAVAPTLGADRKPVFTGLGSKVTKIGSGVFDQWKDAAGRPIAFVQFDPLRGDLPGTWAGSGTSAFTTAVKFDQWYRDVLGVNLSTVITMTLVRQADGTYVFDDKTDPLYSGLGGFFPIDGQLFGNSPANSSHNFHFTTELHTRFTYDAAGGQILRFVGDDDIWVFINGELVLDLGGSHYPLEQFVDLTRLGLVDGQSYTLDLFHAERQTNGSNFRFQTNLLLEDAGVLPTISAAFD